MAHVLLVDDDARVCRVLTLLLTSAGHTVESLQDGHAALTSLSCRRPDVMILDWIMPDLGGPDVLRAVRRDPHLDGLPVVIYTALGDSATEGEAKRLGAHDLVVKTGGWTALYPRLQKYLQ